MRRLLSVFVVAMMTTMLGPMFAKADNQDVADRIAHNLKQSGKMSDYHIAVKFNQGTATVKGWVSNQGQMNTALKLVYQSPGVTRVVNNLTIGESPAKTTNNKKKTMATANRVESSYTNSPIRRTSATEPSELPRQYHEKYAPRPISGQRPIPVAMTQAISENNGGVPGAPQPMYSQGAQAGAAPARYDQASMPNYAWPSYAAYPNYAAVTYPKQYSPTAWPYIGPFYPYPQVPLGWRKVTLEWKDGWWFLDFKDEQASCWR